MLTTVSCLLLCKFDSIFQKKKNSTRGLYQTWKKELEKLRHARTHTHTHTHSENNKTPGISLLWHGFFNWSKQHRKNKDQFYQDVFKYSLFLKGVLKAENVIFRLVGILTDLELK